ncbi:MAG: hypothetical protein ACTHNV_13660 [Ralstonia sp.]|uniref:hypothetical protein n=1 Tax=Ralstonia sp. TaxID=54061 RepID=UPI003F7FC5D6
MNKNESPDHPVDGAFMLSRRVATSTAVLALPLALIACGEKTPADPDTKKQQKQNTNIKPNSY